MAPKKQPTQRKKKTYSEYEIDIKKLYEEIQLIKAYCVSNPNEKETLEELEKKQSSLKKKVENWAKRCNPVVEYARNEGIPWKAEDMPWSDTGRNVTVQPMQLKKDTDIKQVGDYVCYIPEFDVYYPKVVDRKAWDEFPQSLDCG